MKSIKVDPNEGTLGFQIAPMIDVVFVIMLFFMVMAGAVKVEKELPFTLPGTVNTALEAKFVEEQVIQINSLGEVLFNEEPVGKADDRGLENLRGILTRVKLNCDAAKTPCQVTIASEAKSRHQRTMDVLDACAFAGITSVSFNVTEEE